MGIDVEGNAAEDFMQCVLFTCGNLDRLLAQVRAPGMEDWATIRTYELEDDDGKPTGFHVPRLSDMIAWSRDRALVLAEVKESDTLPQVVAEIQAAHAQPWVMLLINSIDDAVALQKLDPSITMTLDTPDVAALDRYAAAGIDLKRVIAWNGIGKRDVALWKALHDRGMTVAYGTLWYVDTTIVNLGLKGIYAELAGQGVDLLATDHPVEAEAEIAAVRPIIPALRQCGAIAPVRTN